jgi:inner membrane protein
VLREPGGWRALYGVSMLGIGTHIAGDWITSYGTMVLAPISDARVALGTTFIIDLWFSGIILAGLALSAFFHSTRLPSVVASLALCGYVGFQYVQKEKALEFGREYARSRGLAGAVVSVHPRPVSPYNWTVFVSDAEAHRFAYVNLARETVREFKPGDGFAAKLDAPYRPLALARWQTRSPPTTA